MKRSNIFLLVLALLAVLVPATVALASDDDSLDARIKKGPPDRDVIWAHRLRLEPNKDRGDWKLHLRRFVMENPDAWVERNRQHVNRELWPLEFREGFEAQTTWKKRILTMKPDEIFELGYEMSNSFLEAPNRENGRLQLLIGISLRETAANLGSPKANYHKYRTYKSLINRYREGGQPKPPIVTCGNGVLDPLWRAARQDHLDATRWLIYEYRSGNCTTKNLPKAYFWALRGQDRNEEVATWAADLKAQLTAAQRQLAGDWFANGQVPVLH